MPEWKRVRLTKSGAKVTVAEVGPGMVLLKQPAVDRRGDPLPAEYPDPAAKKAAPAKRTPAKRSARKTAAKTAAKRAAKKSTVKKAATPSHTSAENPAQTPEGNQA